MIKIQKAIATLLISVSAIASATPLASAQARVIDVIELEEDYAQRNSVEKETDNLLGLLSAFNKIGEQCKEKKGQGKICEGKFDKESWQQVEKELLKVFGNKKALAEGLAAWQKELGLDKDMIKKAEKLSMELASDIKSRDLQDLFQDILKELNIQLEARVGGKF